MRLRYAEAHQLGGDGGQVGLQLVLLAAQLLDLHAEQKHLVAGTWHCLFVGTQIALQPEMCLERAGVCWHARIGAYLSLMNLAVLHHLCAQHLQLLLCI